MKTLIKIYILLPVVMVAFGSQLRAQGMNHLWKELEEKFLYANLKIDTLEEYEEDSILFQRLYFFSHKIDGEPLNVYGIYAQPANTKGKLPAVVSVHGGGGTAEKETVAFLAKRGYAAFSYDWTGYRRPSGKLSGRPAHQATHWPPTVYSSLMLKEDSLELNLFFNSLFIARRAITFIENQKDVDAKKIGITGYSWGGSHTFRLNAMDERIKVAIPTYGVYRWGKTDEMKDRWGEIFGAMEYVDDQIAPMCYITPTNDLEELGNFDNSQAFIQRLKVPHRQVWLANEDHGVRLKAMDAGYRFIDHYLKDAPALAPSPTLTSKIKNESVHVEINAKGATEVSLYYSYGNEKRAVGGFWESVSTIAKGDGIFQIVLPIEGGMRQLQIYAQGYYADTYELSSLRETVTFNENDISFEKENLLYGPMMGITPFYSGWANHSMGFKKSGTCVRVRPSVSDGRLCFVQERSKDGYFPKGGVKIPSLYRAILRSLSDPRRIADKKDKLVIEFYCKSACKLEFGIKNGEKGNNSSSLRKLPEYFFSEELERGNGWRTVELSPNDFILEREGKKESLIDFIEARALHLNIIPSEDEHPEIGKIYWKK